MKLIHLHIPKTAGTSLRESLGLAHPDLGIAQVVRRICTLEKFGIHTTFVDEPNDPAAWREATRGNTKAWFAETIANPSGLVLDIRSVADAAHEAGVPLIVDNTVATPALLRPLEHGADVVVYSATKFLGGHGTAIAGAIVDGGTFDYGAQPERFPNFTEPDPSYNGLVFARDLGADGAFGVNLSYVLRARVCLLRDLGSAPAPFNAWLIAQGLETLTLRLQKHVANAHEVARWLDARPEVTRVQWAGLAGRALRPIVRPHRRPGAGPPAGRAHLPQRGRSGAALRARCGAPHRRGGLLGPLHHPRRGARPGPRDRRPVRRHRVRPRPRRLPHRDRADRHGAALGPRLTPSPHPRSSP